MPQVLPLVLNSATIILLHSRLKVNTETLAQVTEKLKVASAKSLSIRMETQVVAVNLKAGIANSKTACAGVA